MTRNISRRRGLSSDFCRQGDVWTDPSPGIAFNWHLRNHPNEKPIEFLARLVALCSTGNETLLDPFMGSGTTGVACVHLGRKFIGVEIEPRYFDIACKRIAAAWANRPRLFEEAPVYEQGVFDAR